MPEPSDDLTRRLRTEADRLDAAAPPITAADALGATASSDNRRWLPAAAAIVVFAAIGTAWLLLSNDDNAEQLIVPADPPPTTTTTTTTIEPLNTPMGIAVTSVDGPVRVFDLDGTELGTLPAPVVFIEGPELVPTEPPTPVEPIDPAEVPDGCTSAFGGGGVRVALCGATATEVTTIDVIDPTGGSRRLTGPPFDDANPDVDAIAYWTWALPSPDGRWVLASWANGCGGMEAFLTPTVGQGVPLDLAPVPARQASLGLGWTPDGRAILQLGNSACGEREADTGVYLLDPDTRELTLVVELDDSSARAYVWRPPLAMTHTARIIDRAVRELDLEYVAGGPFRDGAVVYFEGHQIGINGTAGPEPPGTLVQRMPLLHGEASIVTPEPDGPTNGLGAIVSFTCGDIDWWLDWYDEGTPEVDSMLLLAEALVPHLYCTLPAADPSG